MKRYPGFALPIPYENYNRRQSRARMNVEGMYGRLKGRWRCLLTPMNFPFMDEVCTIVVACLCLHNLIEREKIVYMAGTYEDEVYENLMRQYHISTANAPARRGRVPRNAKVKRDCLMQFINIEISDSECIRLFVLSSEYATILS